MFPVCSLATRMLQVAPVFSARIPSYSSYTNPGPCLATTCEVTNAGTSFPGLCQDSRPFCVKHVVAAEVDIWSPAGRVSAAALCLSAAFRQVLGGIVFDQIVVNDKSHLIIDCCIGAATLALDRTKQNKDNDLHCKRLKFTYVLSQRG